MRPEVTPNPSTPPARTAPPPRAHAVAGHQVEKQVRAEKQLQVTVRFEDGSIRPIDQEGGSRWPVGDRVRLNNGALLPN